MFAGAASFTDEADINDVNKEAVDTLVALGVIDGYLDGTFRPDDTVTRAEMAKMIYIIRTGRSDASAYNDDATTFTDIGDHWARGYIKYCNSLGIIAGHSATRFAPDATVTTQEAAKMLLVTLGYNAERAGLVGAGWGNKTNALADENGLLKDVNCGTTQGMPRQYAAQLINNAVFAPTVVLRDGEYTNLKLVTGVTGDPDDDYNETIGEKYMGLKVETGIMSATGHTVKGYTMTVGGTPFSEMENDPSSFMGQKVKVLYKQNNEVFGIYAHSDTTVIASGIVNDLDTTTIGSDGKLDFDSTEYKTTGSESAVKVYTLTDDTNYTLATLSSVPDLTEGSTMSLIDNNGDDKIDVAVVTPVRVAKVSFVGTDSITMVAAENAAGGSSYSGVIDLEDAIVYDGIAKGDYVTIVDSSDVADGKYLIEKADVVTGVIKGTKGSVNFTDVMVDSTWYATDEVGTTNNTAFKMGNTIDVVNVNGVLYSSKVTSAAASDSFLVIQALETSYGDVKAKVLLSNGKTEIVTISKYSNDGNTFNDAVYTSSTQLNGVAFVDKVYAYKVVDDEYQVTLLTGSLDADTVLGYDDESYSAVTYSGGTPSTVSGGYAYANEKINSNPISDDAVVFVKDKDGYKTLTGAAAKKWGNTLAGSAVSTYVTSDENGYSYVKVAYVLFNSNVAEPGASDDDMYGYVVADPYASELANGDAAMTLTIWNGTDTITVQDKNNQTALKKHDIVTYTVVDDNTIKVSHMAHSNDTHWVEINSMRDSDILRFTGTGIDSADEYRITEDTVILYVDTKTASGYADGTISIANKNAAGALLGDDNAYFESEASPDDGAYNLKVLVVEVGNKTDFS